MCACLPPPSLVVQGYLAAPLPSTQSELRELELELGKKESCKKIMELCIFLLKAVVFSNKHKRKSVKRQVLRRGTHVARLPARQPRGRIFPSGTLAQPVALAAADATNCVKFVCSLLSDCDERHLSKRLVACNLLLTIYKEVLCRSSIRKKPSYRGQKDTEKLLARW